MAEHLKCHMRQHAERALAAHHDLPQVRPGGLARVSIRFDVSDGRGILLSHHNIADAAVVGAVLPRAPRDDPAAHGGMLKALRKMAAGVRPLCAQRPGSVVERVLQLRAAHTRFYGDGLVHFIEGDHFVEAQAHIQRNTAFHALHAPCDGRAAAIDINRYLFLRTISHNSLDLFLCIRIKHGVRYVFHHLIAQAQDVVHGLAVCNGKARVIVRAHIFRTHDVPKRIQAALFHGAGQIEPHCVQA